MQNKKGGFTEFVDPKAFRSLPKQKLVPPEIAEQRRKERQVSGNVYNPKALVGQAAPIEGAPSIVELARALQNNVDLIYQFVHDNIEFYPNYGLSKGSWGALVDGSGNPFDQADLMVQLLHQAGYTASYVTGYVLLDAVQWSNLLNVSTTDIVLAANLFGDGGFSGTYYTDTNQISIDYCWVQVSIDGTNYVFDPATKTYNYVDGIDLASAMGYTQSAYLADAKSGADIDPSGNFVQNINTTNINNDLTTYAMNLAQWISANNPGASFNDIMSGRTIVPVTGTVRNTSLPYQDTSQPSYVYGYGDLPSSYCATIEIQYDLVGGVYKIDKTYNSAEIYGQRLTVWFNADVEAQLYLNGVVQGTSAVQTSGSSSPLYFTVTHPYATDFADEVSSIPIEAGGWYAVGTGWGYASRQLAELHRQTLLQNISGSATAEAVLGESLSIVWFNFIGQMSSGADVVNRLSSTFTTFHHQIGVILQGTNAILVNFYDNAWITSSLTDTANATAASQHVSLLWHMLEAAVVNQAVGVACASTPSVIAAANLAGTKIYNATINNWVSTVKPALSAGGYTSAELTTIEQTFIAGMESATITGTVAIGDSLHIFVHDAALSTNPTEVSYTTVSGDTTTKIATGLKNAINANTALAAIGVTATSATNVVTIESLSLNNTTYSASVTVGAEVITLLTEGTGHYTLTIPDSASTIIGTYFEGYGYFALAPGGGEFFGPLNNTGKGASSADTTPGDTNSNCSENSAGPGADGVAEQAQFTSQEPIDLFKGRFLYSNTDISVGNQSDPYQLAIVRSYNSGNALNNNGLGLGWSHNYQITAKVNSDGFIAFGYEAVSAAAAVIAQMYVCQDLLDLGAPLPIADMVTICVANLWMMNEIANNTAVVQFGNEYQILARLPNGSFVPPLGVKTSTILTNTGTFAYTTPDKVVYTFNSAGQVSAITYPFGMAIDFTYTSGNLTKVSNGFRTLTLAYSGSNLSTVSDGNGRTVHYTITSSELTTFKDPLAYATTYAYGSGTAGLLTEIYMPANPTNAVVTNVYDTLNRVQTQSDAYGNLWSYYFAGSRSEEIDPSNNSRVLYFDAFGSVLQYTDQLGNTTISQFDGLERPILVTLPEGNSTALSYDQYSNLLTVVFNPKPGSGLTAITNSFTYYLSWNKVKTATDGNTNVLTNTFDSSTGLLTQIQYPAVAAGTPNAYFYYNAIGQVIKVVDPSGVQTSATYDPVTANLLTLVVDSRTGGLNLTSTLTYDDVGNVATATDPNHNTTTTVFDANRRLMQITSAAPLSYVSSCSYDANNNLIQVQSQTATTVLQTYSATYTIDNLLNSATEPPINYWGQQPNPTSYVFDNLRRVHQVIDPAGNLYQYAYDPRSMILQITYPNGVISDSRTYTNNGYLETVTDAQSNTTHSLLDGFDRLSVTSYPDTPATSEQYSYDNNNNVLQFTTRGGGTIGFSYDALNQILTKSPSGQAVVSYSYDLSGRLTVASVPAVSGDPSTGSFQQFYDTAGRFYQEIFPDLGGIALSVTLTLDANGNVTAITYPDSAIISRSYDQLNRLTAISDSLGNVSFAYDPLSRCTLQTAGNGIECGAVFDNGDNLIALTFSPPTSLQFNYAYNTIHQEIARKASNSSFLWEPSSNLTTSYGTVNSVNQYPTVGTNSYSYNGNGCIVSDGTYLYGYDTENHLLSVTGAGVSLSFKYDPLQRQVVKTVGSASTRLIYSGMQRIADYDLSGNFQNRYVFGDELAQPLWVENISTGAIAYLHPDDTGSIIMTSDSSGIVTAETVYTPWGESTTVSSVNLGFTGQRLDPEVGLYYFNNRYYSPKLGRFLQNDPMGYGGGSLNLYEYVNNDPLNSFDPLGLKTLSTGASVSVQAESPQSSNQFDFNAVINLFFQPAYAAGPNPSPSATVPDYKLPSDKTGYSSSAWQPGQQYWSPQQVDGWIKAFVSLNRKTWGFDQSVEMQARARDFGNTLRHSLGHAQNTQLGVGVKIDLASGRLWERGERPIQRIYDKYTGHKSDPNDTFKDLQNNRYGAAIGKMYRGQSSKAMLRRIIQDTWKSTIVEGNGFNKL